MPGINLRLKLLTDFPCEMTGLKVLLTPRVRSKKKRCRYIALRLGTILTIVFRASLSASSHILWCNPAKNELTWFDRRMLVGWGDIGR